MSIVTIGMVAGEISGDVLGARLIKALRKRLNNVNFVGIAGPCMKNEGMESWYDIEELSVMGLLEVVKHLPKILFMRRNLIKRFILLKPNVFVGIDAPDFNLTLEICLKKHGIRTVHYVSPSIWAWRQNRVFKIARAVDLLLILLPFEKEIYNKYKISCKFIGHTLADTIPLNPDKIGARLDLGIPKNKYCLALLPGSRQSEVAMLSAVFLRAAKIVRQKFPDIEILVPLVNSERRAQFESIKAKIAPEMFVRLLNKQVSQQVMIASDVALLASGTATLECMLAKCTMVVGYRVKPITYILIQKLTRLSKLSWISLPNLLARYELVKEFLQEDCQPIKLSQELIFLLKNKKKRMLLQFIFRQLHQQIRCNADDQAAVAILTLIN